MSFVRSMVPPPVQVPAIAANGWIVAGLMATAVGSGIDFTWPSGTASCDAAGQTGNANMKPTKPLMMFDFIISPLNYWSIGMIIALFRHLDLSETFAMSI